MHEAVAYNEMEFSRLEAALRKELENDSVETDAIFRRNVAFAAYLSLYTGERCGEVCANTVADAQLLRHIMHISHTAVESDGMVWRKPKPKGKKSRNVALDDGTVQAIKRHYAWQAGYLPSRLCNSSERTICTDAEGGILRPHKVSEAFRDIRDAANLPKNTSFHTLRHTHATWLLLSGVDLKTISERLGHANEALTLQIYSHVMPGRDEAAAATFARTATAFGGGAYGIR
jgi:integrase